MSFPLIPSVDIGNGIRRSPLSRNELLAIPYPDEPDVNTTCTALISLFTYCFVRIISNRTFSKTDHVMKRSAKMYAACIFPSKILLIQLLIKDFMVIGIRF